MLTYQLHTRIFQIENNEKFSFPNEVQIEIKLSPPTAFGKANSPSRTLVKGRAAKLTINANTGRWLALSTPPLEPLEVVIESPTSKFTLKGENLTYSFHCESIPDLEGTIMAFKWVLPSLINLEFSDPPTVLHVRGSVGKTKFRWEHRPEEWQIQMRTVEPDNLEKRIAESFEALPLFNGLNNRRLAAALYYFHVGVRLNVCGDSPWEFMAESILNFSKSLEILFSISENSKDDIRRELTILGFTQEEIEGDFIPLLILRSFVDVAHPKVAIFKARDLQILYKYLAQSEEKIRRLLKIVLKKVAEGTYGIRQEKDLFLSKDDRKGMDKLIATMESRIEQMNWSS